MNDLNQKKDSQESKKLEETELFPFLNMGIGELQKKIVSHVVPEGFYKEGTGTYVKGKKFISSSDIQFLIDEVNSFCHNERVRLLTSVRNLQDHFKKEMEEVVAQIVKEETKNFINRNMSGLQVLREYQTRLKCKLEMLEFIFKMINQ